MKRTQDGFTLLEIMIVVAIVGMLAVMASPSFLRTRDLTNNSVCINNLRILVTAKNMFAFDAGRKHNDPVEAHDVNPYLKHPFDQMKEPAGGDYDLRPIGHDPLCTVGHVY